MSREALPSLGSIKEYIGEVPEECRGKFKSHYRTSEDFKDMFPYLNQKELSELVVKVNETYPESSARIKLIDQYYELNKQRKISDNTKLHLKD